MTLNYVVLNNEQFVAWQKEKERKIVQIHPILGGIHGDANMAQTDMKSSWNVFVLYQEE